MAPAMQRLLQTASQKHNASPTPFRKRRNFIPSPLIACPEAGIVSNGIPHREDDKLQQPFLFRPTIHSEIEKKMESERKPTVVKIKRDIKRINQLLPIDILIRSLKQQASKTKIPLDPIPILLKLSPQMRRVKNKRNFKKPRFHRKKPESGRLIPLLQKPSITIEQIMATPTGMAVEARPKVIAQMLVSKLLDLRPQVVIHGSLSEVIASRRKILYLEEGACWMQIFIPGAREDDPHVPPVFKLFDNTDKGVPEELMQNRDHYGSLTTYQFRVLAKRYAIGGGMDLAERVLFAEILGMTEEAVHCFFLEMRLVDELKGLTERQIQSLLFDAFSDSSKMSEIEDDAALDMLQVYKHIIVPIPEGVVLN